MITEAVSSDNLCMMYEGWMAWVWGPRRRPRACAARPARPDRWPHRNPQRPQRPQRPQGARWGTATRNNSFKPHFRYHVFLLVLSFLFAFVCSGASVTTLAVGPSIRVRYGFCRSSEAQATRAGAVDPWPPAGRPGSRAERAARPADYGPRGVVETAACHAEWLALARAVWLCHWMCRSQSTYCCIVSEIWRSL